MNIKCGGSWLSGTNTPPMNNNGNFTIFMRIMISEVISVGVADIKSANRDPNIPMRAIPIKTTNNESGKAISAGKSATKTIAMIKVMIVE